MDAADRRGAVPHPRFQRSSVGTVSPDFWRHPQVPQQTNMADGQPAVDRVKGYLTVTVAEASGRNRDDEEVWDAAFVEGYVKGPSRASTAHCSIMHIQSDADGSLTDDVSDACAVEIRGGPRNVKVCWQKCCCTCEHYGVMWRLLELRSV